MTNRFRTLLSVFFFLLAMCFASAQEPAPHLWSRVTDEAGVISSETLQQLESSLKVFEDSTSNQVVVLIIRSLNGEALEDYSIRIAQENGIGQKDKDNGVLLLIAIDDHKMRIEVGYGLEGVLTDAICSQIIRNELAPNFRREDYDQGVTAGVNAITAAIGGEYLAEENSEAYNDLGMSLGAQIGVALVVFGILGLFTYPAVFGKGWPGWFLYFFMMPFWAAFPSAIFGWGVGSKIFIGYVVGAAVLRILAILFGWTKNMSSGSGSGGSWSSGSGWSSGSSSSSFDSGSSFSGGGGSFGGGGSSGSW